MTTKLYTVVLTATFVAALSGCYIQPESAAVRYYDDFAGAPTPYQLRVEVSVEHINLRIVPGRCRHLAAGGGLPPRVVSESECGFSVQNVVLGLQSPTLGFWHATTDARGETLLMIPRWVNRSGLAAETATVFVGRIAAAEVSLAAGTVFMPEPAPPSTVASETPPEPSSAVQVLGCRWSDGSDGLAFGNGNRHIDPGEKIEVTCLLTNSAARKMREVRLEATSVEPTVAVFQGSRVTYAWNVNEQRTVVFGLSLRKEYAGPDRLPIVLRVSSADAGGPLQLALEINRRN